MMIQMTQKLQLAAANRRRIVMPRDRDTDNVPRLRSQEPNPSVARKSYGKFGKCVKRNLVAVR